MMQLYNKKKIIKFGECIVVLFICFFFTCGKYNVKYSAIIENVYPVEVWKYVSDFKNMKILNPMIISFEIDSKNGSHDYWKYKVHYTENLSQLPLLTNFASAIFEIKILSKNIYAIYSNHTTCFLTSFTCVNTNSSFIVETTENPFNTKYTEYITYECPMIFSSFCKKEVYHQRTIIRENLKRTFKN